MFNIAISWKIKLLIVHILLGLLLFYNQSTSTYIGLILIAFGTYRILLHPNYNEKLSLYFSSYIVGIEVLLRMCSATLFWEYGKYAIIYFIILGIFRSNNTLRLNLPVSIYFLLLIPSIIIIPIDSIDHWRQSISFNLSGPACLAIVSCYIYNIKINRDSLVNILFFSLLPIISMSVIILMKMPNIESYIFLPYSNPITSGGYGPNQVSTIFGFIIAGILLGKLMKTSITGNKYLDLLLMFIFVDLGFITFSRGGLFAAIISVVVTLSYYFFREQNKTFIFFKTIFICIIVIISWFIIVDITDGAISKRYGIEGGTYGDRLFLDLTGRAQIYSIDLNIFSDYVFTGCGPGQANKLREQYGYSTVVAAHTEFTRMLAEHGILGLFSLLVLLCIPIVQLFMFDYPSSKIIKLLFGTLALLTMFHSAMRIAMPCFIYGFSLINFEE